MTAMSAQRASKTPSTANSFLAESATRTVLLPGSPGTYANRAFLRDLGLRWDPDAHRWHGQTTAKRVRELRDRLGLEVRVFGQLESAPKDSAAPKPDPQTRPATGPVSIAVPTRDPARRLHDGSRTRLEARIAFPASGEEPNEIETPARKFTLVEITSGLPDDSREEDERQEERHLRDLRARVKRARAVAEGTPGLAELLQGDSRKAARFYARFGIAEGMFRHGVSAETSRCPRSLRRGQRLAGWASPPLPVLGPTVVMLERPSEVTPHPGVLPLCRPLRESNERENPGFATIPELELGAAPREFGEVVVRHRPAAVPEALSVPAVDRTEEHLIPVPEESLRRIVEILEHDPAPRPL